METESFGSGCLTALCALGIVMLGVVVIVGTVWLVCNAMSGGVWW